jgi:NAD(P)H-hydrate epimerase
MERAGTNAAAQLLNRFAHALSGGAAVFAGPGNNGGDAWVVARELHLAGVSVAVQEVRPPSTAEARRAKDAALAAHGFVVRAPDGNEGVVVDGLLGTGAVGAPRGEILEAVHSIESARRSGSLVAALDMPTGLDATTGVPASGLTADITLTFGSVKRGHLINRVRCGTIVVLDIGLRQAPAAVPRFLEPAAVMARVPEIPVNAHKGDRRRIAILGGATGMTGAAILAARGALRSGAGLVRVLAPANSLNAIQAAVPQALTAQWPASEDHTSDLVGQWAHTLVLGPGLGTGERSRRVLHLALAELPPTCVVDADALNIIAAGEVELKEQLHGRPCVITPHAGEMARLLSDSTANVLESRFEVAPALARKLGAVVLLKGVPTIIASPDGRVAVSASGSPALATGGSGDVLAGMLGVMLAHTGDPFLAASIAVVAHGLAGEMAASTMSARGATLDDVLSALGKVWRSDLRMPTAPVLAEIPLPPS